MTKLDTTWVSTKDSFAALAATWNSLASLTDDKSIFLQHGWFEAAWQWRLHDCSMAILCVHQDNRVIGILPLVLERQQRYSLTFRCLCAFDLPDTQQFSLLCAPENALIVAQAIGKELARTAADRDWLQLRKLHQTAANAALLKVLEGSKRIRVISADPCLCVKLNDRWETYYSRRSRRLKKGNNLIANKLKGAFQSVEVTRVILDTSEAGAKALNELCDLAESSWKKNLATALYKLQPRAWIDRLRQTLGDSGALSAWTLRLNGALAAAELQLEHSGIVAALRADTREEFDGYGTGTYLNWKVLESLMDGQRILYNMGPGISEYKERWAEERENLTAVDVSSSTFVGYLLWTIDYRLRPLGKKIAGLTARKNKP